MTCPFCDEQLSRRQLHAHLSQAHPEQVQTVRRADRQLYQVSCPYCGAEYSQRIKKAAGDESFVAEFEQQIRMVAFDMLINHLLVEHETQPAGG